MIPELASYATGFAPRDGEPMYPCLYEGLVASYRPYHGQSNLMVPNTSRYGTAIDGTLGSPTGADYLTTEVGTAMWFQAVAVSNRVDCGLIPQLPAIGRPNISVAALVRPLDVTLASAGIFDNSQGGGLATVRLFFGRDLTRMKINAGDGVAVSTFTSDLNAFTLHQWSSVVMTIRSDNVISYYLNGVPWGTSALDRDIAASAVSWKIGLAFATNVLGGDEEIAYVHAYNRVLTQPEAALLHRDPHAASRIAA